MVGVVSGILLVLGYVMVKKVVLETVREAVLAVKAELKEDSSVLVQALKDPEKFCIRVHSSYGRWMRNEWGLWSGGALKEELEGLGIKHPDDMSHHILITAVQELKNAEEV